MGKVWFPKHAPWKTDVLSQLLMFPAGKHDDAVDVFSLIGRGLEVMVSAGKPANESHYYRAGSWLS
jgi:phage terminase large subunit-like protein